MKKLSLLIGILWILSACSGSQETDTSDDAEASSDLLESIMAEVGHEASATEGTNSLGSLSLNRSLSANLQSLCSFSAARSTCSSNVDTIAWNGCSVGTATLSGGWTETWSPGFCADGSKPGILTNSNSVTRTSSQQILTLATGASITTSTEAHSTYDGTSIPGTGVTASMASGVRTVVINGLHRIMTGRRGHTLFNHTITSSGLTITGTRSAGTRVVNGSATMFHNIALYKAAHTFTNVTWGSSTCCYPTSGAIYSSLTGSRNGNASMTFSSSCGQAVFTDTSGATSNVTLTQCY